MSNLREISYMPNIEYDPSGLCILTIPEVKGFLVLGRTLQEVQDEAIVILPIILNGNYLSKGLELPKQEERYPISVNLSDVVNAPIY